MDWAGLLRLGLGALRLSPAEFWALTPIELVLSAGLDTERAPMTRAGLDALLTAHPDRTEETGDGA